jgi:hypothetical protein
VARVASYATWRSNVKWWLVKWDGIVGGNAKPGPRPLTCPLAPPRPCHVNDVSAQQCLPYGGGTVASLYVNEWKGPSVDAFT